MIMIMIMMASSSFPCHYEKSGEERSTHQFQEKMLINAFGDNPLQQSAIKSLKHSFHHTAHQENNTDALQKPEALSEYLDYLQSVLKQVDIFGTLEHTC